MFCVNLHGRLVADPQLRQVGNSQAANFTLACDTAKMEDNGRPKAEFVYVTVWGKRGESCAKYLHKGDQLVVVGDCYLESFVRQNGEKATQVRVNANTVQFCGKSASSHDDSGDDDLE